MMKFRKKCTFHFEFWYISFCGIYIQITPDQLKDEILNGVQSQINELKKHFQPKAPTEYLTRREVANLLGVNLTTLNNWTRKGILKSYGIGGRVYYKRNEVENAVIELKN